MLLFPGRIRQLHHHEMRLHCQDGRQAGNQKDGRQLGREGWRHHGGHHDHHAGLPMGESRLPCQVHQDVWKRRPAGLSVRREGKGARLFQEIEGQEIEIVMQ